MFEDYEACVVGSEQHSEISRKLSAIRLTLASTIHCVCTSKLMHF